MNQVSSELLHIVYNADSKLRKAGEEFLPFEKTYQDIRSVDQEKKIKSLELYSSDDMSWDYYGNPYFNACE